jgi:hypothetical protein
MQDESPVDELKFLRAYQLFVGNGDPIERAFQVIFPECQEGFEAREFRSEIKILPDEGLQEMEMIGHAIEDFRSGETVPLQLLQKMLIGHRHLFD